MPFLPFYDRIDPGQGGSAMVIPEYPRWNIDLKPEVFPCGQCNLTFGSYDEWFEHRFQLHPIARPMLVLGDVEMVTPRFVVMQALKTGQVRAVNAESCLVNGTPTSMTEFAERLAMASNAFFNVTLVGADGGSKTSYEISVELPAPEHLHAVELAFARIAATGSLSLNSINSFVREVANASTARRYLDGLSGYLFGVLAKDQRGDTGLTQEQGRTKLNEAHQTLMLIDRPLAKVVRAVIEFQANVFLRTRGVSVAPRLLQAMQWFESAHGGHLAPFPEMQVIDGPTPSRVPLDAATDELLTWASLPVSQLMEQLRSVEKRCRQPDWLPDDRAKARVLFAALQLAQGDHAGGIQTARAFRHDPVFQHLSENLLASSANRVAD